MCDGCDVCVCVWWVWCVCVWWVCVWWVCVCVWWVYVCVMGVCVCVCDGCVCVCVCVCVWDGCLCLLWTEYLMIINCGDIKYFAWKCDTKQGRKELRKNRIKITLLYIKLTILFEFNSHDLLCFIHYWWQLPTHQSVSHTKSYSRAHTRTNTQHGNSLQEQSIHTNVIHVCLFFRFHINFSNALWNMCELVLQISTRSSGYCIVKAKTTDFKFCV